MRFLDLVGDYLDRYISLDVIVKPSTPEEFDTLHYLADCSDGQLAITKWGRGQDQGGLEVVRGMPGMVGNRWCKLLRGRFHLRGEFLVRGGGFQQGIASFGLISPRRSKARSADRSERPRVPF
jgi:hypothetical protein